MKPPGRVAAPQDRLPSYLLSVEIRLPTVRSARAPEGAPVISQVGSRLLAEPMVDFVDELGMVGSEKALGEECMRAVRQALKGFSVVYLDV